MALLMIWLKFLYFLRIFEATSSIIRMITQVIFDIKYFLLVLLLTIVAFGDAFKTISQGNPALTQAQIDAGEPELRFVADGFFGSFFYVYNMCLGDFSTDFGEIQVGLAFFLFFLCTMFNMIIMLNLLISIISESFARIAENLKSAAYQERAGMISENSFMIPKSRKVAFCERNKYLVIATDISGEVSIENDELAEALDGLKKQVYSKIDSSQRQILRAVDKKLDSQESLMKSKLGLLLGEEDLSAQAQVNAERSYASLPRDSTVRRDTEEGEAMGGDIHSQVQQLGSLMRQAVSAHVAVRAEIQGLKRSSTRQSQ